MKNKIRKIIRIAIILLIVIAVGISKGREIYDNSHVRFADETMGKVICKSIRGNTVTPESVTRKGLKGIKRLEIGFVSYYKTLRDIKYCTGVEKLTINLKMSSYDPAFTINQGEVDRKLSEDEIEKVQKELEIILPKLSNLKELWLSDMGGCNWTSLDFLKNCNQIEKIYVSCTSIKDYSGLQGCTSLKVIDLEGTQISRAEDIIGLEHLEFIVLFDTPLAEKPEEIKKLQEAYPDAEIRWERRE